jgi:MFS family permease
MSPSERRNSLIVIMVSIAVAGVGWGLSSPILAIMMENAGISRTIIGLNTAMGAVATLIYMPLAPRILRRFGTRETLLVGMVVAALSVLSFKLLPILEVWFVTRFIFGAALAVLFVSTEVWINSIAQEGSRGRILGLYGTCLSGGFAIGVGILSIQGTDTWAPFLTAAGLIFLALVVILLSPARAPALSGGPEISMRPIINSAPMVMAAAIVFGAVEMGILTLLPVYGERAGLEESQAILMLMAAAAGNVALQVPIGWLADKLDRRLVLGMCASTGVLGAILIPLSLGTPWLLYLILFITGGVIVGLYTVALVLIGERFQGPSLASANATFILMYGVGSLVGPGLAGVSMDLWDPHGLMAVLGGICALYVAGLVARRKMRGSAPSPVSRG